MPAVVGEKVDDHRITENVQSSEELSRYLVSSIEAGVELQDPFFHLEFQHIFPNGLYQKMLAAMPLVSDYRAMAGRSKDRVNATPTRVKIDLFPEFIRHFPSEKLALWDLVGRALCSEPVKDAFRRRLAKALEKRFGSNFANVGMYPIPILTRDISGYRIKPHTDTHWKGITVQLYLPPDEAHTNIGTIFHSVLPDGSKPKTRQMRFAPNTGYAFAVGDDTWHSADTVGPEVKSRDSILLTYFVDAGLLRVARNRGKRLGNFLQNEFRYHVGAK
jgi:hypothetical protein